MPQPFDHELKILRAAEHLKDFSGKVATWFQGDHHSIRYETDMHDGRTVFLASAEKIPQDPFSLIVGDCLHNLRSSLDLLAFALASEYTKPLPDDIADSSEFPIFGDEDRQGNMGVGSGRFNQRSKTGDPVFGSGLHKIRGMHPNAQAIIEGLQPYHRGNAYRAHPLSMLHYLDRLSKHRLLHVVAASFGGFFLHPTRSRNWQLAPGAIESYEGIIETDTVVTRIPLQRVDPNVEMYVEIQPAFDVAFAQVPGMQNISVFKTLTDCYNFIIGEVLPPLFPFLS